MENERLRGATELSVFASKTMLSTHDFFPFTFIGMYGFQFENNTPLPKIVSVSESTLG